MVATAERPLVHEPQALRWTKAEYYRMGEAGLFEGKRVELIDGEIIEMQPVGVRHVRAVNLASRALARIFGDAFTVSVQNPFDIGDNREPQPDLAVIAGDPRVLEAHPTAAALLVEVADSTLFYDRGHKASLYARAGIGDYWIVNLVDNVLEIRRRPAPMPEQPFGFGYADINLRRAGDTVAPLAAPQIPVAVADLLP